MEPIKPKLDGWDFTQRERQLVDNVGEIPTWSLANKSRQMLADVLVQLWQLVPTVTAPTVDDLDLKLARELAALQLTAIVARSISAEMALIGCGYEREALQHLRSAVEAWLWLQKNLDENTLATARLILKGRLSNTKQVARKYGSEREIKILDHFAHADSRSLMPLTDHTGSAAEGRLELRPQRGRMHPSVLLLDASHISGETCAAACEVFGVGFLLPPCIAREFAHFKDAPLPGPL